MSWDEKDWAYTWVTGKKERLNLLFRRFVFDEKMKLLRFAVLLFM